MTGIATMMGHRAAAERRPARSRRRRCVTRWLSRRATIFAFAALAVAAVHPPHGLDLPICMMKSTTGIDCPGCGMTRSLSCASRGMIEASVAYHPFGLPLLALLVTTCVIALLPRRRRRRIAATVMRHHRIMNGVYATFVVLFIAYGVGRAFL